MPVYRKASHSSFLFFSGARARDDDCPSSQSRAAEKQTRRRWGAAAGYKQAAKDREMPFV